MAETIANWFIASFQDVFTKEVMVFLISMLPVLELRGGLIAAFAMQMPWLPAFFIAFVGNLLPIPFILMFIRFVFQVLKQTPLKGFVNWCETKADKKSEQIRKYAYLGVFLFVAIPLPGTGAWMGALISVLLNMDGRKTFPVIVLGVLVAGVIVSILTYGLLGSLGFGA